jgi:HK97 family phage major capsid protein
MNKKGLEEKRNDLKVQLNSILENAKKEERAMNEEEISKFDELEKEIKNINETIEREDKMINMEEKEVKKEERELTVEERDSKAFVNYIRNVIEERAEANLSTGDNGAIIPTTIAKKIIAKAYDMSSILKDATKYNTKGKVAVPVYGANGSNDINMAYHDEFEELEGKAGKFTSVELGNHLAGALAKIGKSLISNTDIDLENKVIELVAEAVARFQEKECLIGTDGKVAGLRGVKLQVVAASNSVLTADDLIKVKNKVKKRFRKNAKWIMSNDTLTAIELLKDGEDRFIFRDDLTGEFDGYILGYPVEVSDNMPEIGASANVVYFGDYSGLALKQRDDALELNVLREKYATQHAVGINAWVEFDAKVENEQKIAKLTMGA